MLILFCFARCGENKAPTTCCRGALEVRWTSVQRRPERSGESNPPYKCSTGAFTGQTLPRVLFGLFGNKMSQKCLTFCVPYVEAHFSDQRKGRLHLFMRDAILTAKQSIVCVCKKSLFHSQGGQKLVSRLNRLSYYSSMYPGKSCFYFQNILSKAGFQNDIKMNIGSILTYRSC